MNTTPVGIIFESTADFAAHNEHYLDENSQESQACTTVLAEAHAERSRNHSQAGLSYMILWYNNRSDKTNDRIPHTTACVEEEGDLDISC